MILQSNVNYLWNSVVNPRLGVAPYAWGGSFDPNNPAVGTDCSGAVSAELCALIYGPAMPWVRQFWTGTFAGAQPGDIGPFGGVPCTRDLLCIASPTDAPADAAMVIAVRQEANPADAHMICRVQGITLEMGGVDSTYHSNPPDTNANSIFDTSEFNQWLYLPGPIGNTVQGLDYSGGQIPGATLAANGYAFACRYVTDGGPGFTTKLLTAAEANDLQANGIGIVSNWEYAADQALNGFSQGVQDAQTANANHLAAGAPPDRPIYFSIDFDEDPSQDPALIAYFQGIASVIGLPRTGAYGGYWVIKRMFDAGVITWGWQTEAWSGDPGALGPDDPFGDGDYLDPRANILQRNAVGFVPINGIDCDLDEALTADFGQWNYQVPAPTPTPGGNVPDYAQLAYEQLAGPIQADGYGHGWPQLGTDGHGNDLTLVDAIATQFNELLPHLGNLDSQVGELQATVNNLAAMVAALMQKGG